MISADVKQQEIKGLVPASYNFLYKRLENLKYVFFHLILPGVLSSLRLSVEKRVGFKKLVLIFKLLDGCVINCSVTLYFLLKRYF